MSRSMTKTPLMTKVAASAVAILAAAALSLATIPAVIAYSEGSSSGEPVELTGKPASYEKAEIVYATLAADGEVEAAYIVNQFDVDEAGDIEDFGVYDSVVNLTNETPLASEGDAISFVVAPGSFYYQGSVEGADLPWIVSLSYELDGKPISPQGLAGKTGDLVIRLTTERNEAVDPSFADSFMQQITFTLNGDTTTDIVAEGATIASSGRDRTVAFTVLPGDDADCVLSAHVTDFEMVGVQIAGLPYSMNMELPDTDGLVGDMEQLVDAIAQLNDGAQSLASGIRELEGGANAFAEGASQLGEGLGALDGSSDQLVSGSAEIKAALELIAGQLGGVGEGQFDVSDMAELEELPATLRALATELDGLSAQIVQLQAGFSAAQSGLDAAIRNIPEPTVSQEDIDELKGVAATHDETAGTNTEGTATVLAETYWAAQEAKAIYESPEYQQVVEGADAVLIALAGEDGAPGALSSLSATLNQIADGIEATSDIDFIVQLGQLAAGLEELSENYGSFHAGLEEYAAGIGELTAGFSSLVDGADELAGGIGQLSDGADSLAAGTNELADETASVPETMKEEIDAMMEDYDFPDWKPVSFTSSQNEHTTAVQFVMTTAAIEVPEEPEAEEEPEEELTIIDRFWALFS